MLSQAMENYLKVIYEILEKEERASTSAIAARMGLSSPSLFRDGRELEQVAGCHPRRRD